MIGTHRKEIMQTSIEATPGIPPSAPRPLFHNPGEQLKPYSTLIALMVLMIVFEIAGRIWNSDFQAAFQELLNGESGAAGRLLSAAHAGLYTSEMAFLGARNLTNLALQVSINGILAVGMTFVVLSGGIDLSIGSVVALCGIFLGLVQVKAGLGVAAGVAAAITGGTLVGALNGFFISRFKIPPFVITLGLLVIARGLALSFSNRSAISPMGDGIRWLGSGFLSAGPTVLTVAILGALILFLRKKPKLRNSDKQSVNDGFKIKDQLLPLCLVGSALALFFFSFLFDRGLPIPVLILAVCALLAAFLLVKTTFGRSVYAVGGNETAALLSGIDVKNVKLLIYTIMGFLSGVAGVVLAGRLNSATPTEGQLMELDAIAAVVIGGTSLQGGVGKIQGSIIGAFIIGALNSGMDMLELSTDYQMVMKGLIIVFAVWSDSKVGGISFFEKKKNAVLLKKA